MMSLCALLDACKAQLHSAYFTTQTENTHTHAAFLFETRNSRGNFSCFKHTIDLIYLYSISSNTKVCTYTIQMHSIHEMEIRTNQMKSKEKKIE